MTNSTTWLLYEHATGRHAAAPSAESATFAHGDPAWHRVGTVEVVLPAGAAQTDGLSDEQIVQIGHRKASQYLHNSANPNDNLQALYTFNDRCLRDFARAVLSAAAPAATPPNAAEPAREQDGCGSDLLSVRRRMFAASTSAPQGNAGEKAE